MISFGVLVPPNNIYSGTIFFSARAKFLRTSANRPAHHTEPPPSPHLTRQQDFPINKLPVKVPFAFHLSHNVQPSKK